MDTAYNNNVSGEREFGKSRPIFSDVGLVNLTGGFKVTLTDVPAIADGYIPAGTPMQVDESTRTVKIFKVAKVATATDVAGALTIDIEKELDTVNGFGRNPLKVGDIIMVLGSSMTTAGLAVKITAIDRSATTKDVLTVNDELIAAKGDFLVLANEESASAAVPAVVPNCITPYDIKKNEYATAVYADACVGLLYGVVYERRIPMLPNIVKQCLLDNGCNFVFSQSK